MESEQSENWAIKAQDGGHSGLLGNDRLRARAMRVQLTLFLWLCLALVFDLCAFTDTSLERAALFVLLAFCGMIGPSLFAGRAETADSSMNLSLIAGYAIALVLPSIVGPLDASPRAILLDMYLITLVATPALLRSWSWEMQSIAGIAAIAASAIQRFGIQDWSAIHSIVLVTVISFLASFVSYMRRDDESRALALAETAGIRHLDTLSTSQLPQAVWGITMLQSGLVVVLVFLEVAFWGGDVSDQLVAKLYGLMYVLVGSLLLAIVRPRYVGVGLVLNTGIIAVALLISEALNAESNIVRGALPVLFLAATTLRLPWQISYNIAVHWLLLAVSFATKLIPFWNESRSFEDAAEMALAIYRSELLVIVVGLVGLTLLARLLSRHALLNLVQLSEEPEAIAHEQNAVTTLVRQAEIGLLAERIRQLVAGLFILGICSCFCSSILLFRMNISLWPVAAAGWLVFFGLWSALLYLERREGTNEQLWFGGAFIALVLFLWPSILLLYSDAPGRFWIYWPISLLVGLGAIPWSFVELVPLVAAVVVTGFEILQKLDLGLMAAALFGIALLLSLLLSAQGSRRIRENYLLTNFHDAIRHTNSYREAMHVLLDSLMSLFDCKSSVLQLGTADLLELIRDSQSYPLRRYAWPLQRIRDSIESFDFQGGGVGIHVVRWLPSSLSVFDERFGIFSAKHGLIIELELDDSPILVFLAFRVPFFSSMKLDELQLARTLTAVTLFQLRLLKERARQQEHDEMSRGAQNEREFELSALVHDINNTVQDLTLLCDSMIEEGYDDLPGAMRSGDSSESFDKRVQKIATIARSMATVVSDAKRKRELERQIDLTPRELVEVGAVLDELTAFAAVRAERKRIKVIGENLANDSLWIRISAREHFETILRNLLNNAILYSNPGSEIKVVRRASDAAVMIDVIDNGPGLTEEEAQQIFLSGFRGRSGRNSPGGLGIGLNQSRRVAESAGGTLSVYSEGPGRGSKFTVSLPRVEVPHIDGSHAAWALMVDDQPTLTEFYGRVAKALHLAPELASSVEDACAILERRGRPTFVLTDLHLGSSSGFDLIRFVRELFGPSVPILVVSGMTDEDIEERSRKAGATDFLAKPIGRRALFARIQSLLPGL